MTQTPPDHRNVARKMSLAEDNDDGLVLDATPAERLQMVWPLTRDCWAFLPNPDAHSNFKDMLTVLRGAEADYLLIGAYAMAALGCPRATGDIDIWIRPTPDNAVRVWKALQPFGCRE